MKKILAVLIMAILPMVAGCGGGGGSSTPATVGVLKLSATPGTLPALKKVSGVAVTVELPTGVTVKLKADGVTVDDTVVVASGLFANTTTPLVNNSTMTPITYTPAAGAVKAKLDFTVASLAPLGVGEGEYVTITCILNGTSPVPADFNLLKFDVNDMTFTPMPAVTAAKALTLQ